MIDKLCEFSNKLETKETAVSSKGIYISLPVEILNEIDEICGGPSLPQGKKRTGTTGGRAAWVRRLVYEALGKEIPEGIHEKRKQRFQQLVEEKAGSQERDDWSDTVKRLKALRGEGLSLRQIGEVLRKEGRATRRGGKWTAQTVRNALL
jgi:Recombinase